MTLDDDDECEGTEPGILNTDTCILLVTKDETMNCGTGALCVLVGPCCLQQL
jgi:hypothetical protein